MPLNFADHCLLEIRSGLGRMFLEIAECDIRMNGGNEFY